MRTESCMGDLKPGNIIVAADGKPKVIDFGMARFIARPDGTRQSADFGSDPVPKAVSLRYASPGDGGGARTRAERRCVRTGMHHF